MKNTLSSVSSTLCAVLLFFLFLTGIGSCKKDQLPLSVAQSINKLSDNQKVHTSEVTSWINTALPADQHAQIQLTNAAQNIIDQQHVVRVPIGKNAALFFTKVNSKMQVYAYKWLNKNAGTELYTGYITAYSFQTNTAKEFSYNDSKIIKQSYLRVNTETKTIEPINRSSAASRVVLNSRVLASQATNSINLSLFGELWCWLTGGTYITERMIANGTTGSNGEMSEPGCDYGAGGGGGDGGGDAGDAGGDYGYSGDGTFSFGDPTFGAVPDPNSGGGPGWVNVYVPNPNGCVTDAGGTMSFVPGCSNGDWVTFQLPVAGVDYMSPDIIDVMMVAVVMVTMTIPPMPIMINQCHGLQLLMLLV